MFSTHQRLKITLQQNYKLGSSRNLHLNGPLHQNNIKVEPWNSQFCLIRSRNLLDLQESASSWCRTTSCCHQKHLQFLVMCSMNCCIATTTAPQLMKLSSQLWPKQRHLCVTNRWWYPIVQTATDKRASKLMQQQLESWQDETKIMELDNRVN